MITTSTSGDVRNWTAMITNALHIFFWESWYISNLLTNRKIAMQIRVVRKIKLSQQQLTCSDVESDHMLAHMHKSLS